MSRCEICRKKLNLAASVTGLCKCKGVFCSEHRQFEDHGCTFKEQAKTEGIEKLKKTMVPAVPEKLIRI